MPEYVVRTLPGEHTVRVQRPGGVTRVRTRLIGSDAGGSGAPEVLSVDVAIADGDNDIDLDGAAPGDVPAVLIWGRASGNGVYSASIADGWTLLDEQPTLVVADSLLDGSDFSQVLDTGVKSLYQFDGGWVPVGSVPTLDGNPSQVWGPTGWVTPDSGGVELGETSTTAYRGDRGKTAYDHSQVTTGNPHGTTPADIGAAPASHTHEYPASTFTYVTDGEGGYDIVGGPYVAGSARIFIGPDDPAAAGFTPADGDQWENTSG